MVYKLLFLLSTIQGIRLRDEADDMQLAVYADLIANNDQK